MRMSAEAPMPAEIPSKVWSARVADEHRTSAGGAERILLAPDSFKGTLTASEVIAALAGPLREAGYEVAACPLADGGEGTAEALLAAAGGRRVEADAHDPL